MPALRLAQPSMRPQLNTVSFTAGQKTISWKNHGLAPHQPITISGSTDATIVDGKYWVQASNLTTDSFELRKIRAAAE